MKATNLLIVSAIAWWVWRKSRPVPAVVVSSQWFDPVSNTWRDF